MKKILSPYPILVLFYSLTFTRGFTFLGNQVIHRQQSTSRHQISLEDLPDFLSDEFESQPKIQNSVQLWLDLRGTAIHPKAAIEYLEEQLMKDPNDATDLSISFDRIILSDDMFQKLLKSSDEFVNQSELLYAPQEALSTLALSRDGLSFPFGKIVSTAGSVALGNPITAMETLSSGQWVIFDNKRDDDEVEDSRITSVGDFLDIVSTATDWGSTAEMESGLFLQTENLEEEKKLVGGVAVNCPTSSSIMQLASTIECLDSGRSTTVTSSGVLIHEENGDSSPLTVALMLPFDFSLWKTALVVYGKMWKET